MKITINDKNNIASLSIIGNIIETMRLANNEEPFISYRVGNYHFVADYLIESTTSSFSCRAVVRKDVRNKNLFIDIYD